MRNNLIAGIKKIGIGVAMVAAFLVGNQAKAAETTTLRVISTTDLHNQVSSEDYDIAGKNAGHSLAKLSTMIKAARAELNQGASLTVDAGDSVYGYGAEVLMGDVKKPSNTLQPIFEAMSKIGYDAITLGNHEFDYGYDFIKNQLTQSGLNDKCVVANVKEYATGNYPWKRTMMLTKNMTTSAGNTVAVKVGIVGVTKQELSTYYEYDGVLEGESILKTVREQAAALKSAGADIVVVIGHCGMGEANDGDSATDPGYAISKLANVDCVMLGHQHRNYPSNDASTKLFYRLPNTDKTTGLTNGKPVVMVADHAAGIGIADMTLKIDNGKVSVVHAATEVRKSSESIRDDQNIVAVDEKSANIIKNTFKEVLASVASGSVFQGYFGVLNDNYAIQLNNEAKIRFGMNFIHSNAGAAYVNYPVISATGYYMDGSEGKNDYMDIQDSFTMKDVLNTQEYEHNNDYAYWITGKQLRKWMEWSASIFAQQNEMITSTGTIKKLSEEYGTTSLVAEKWLKRWGPFQVFDGIEYQIDASKPAMYNVDGELINSNTSRIVNLTCNGQPVTDDSKFILVTNYISKNKAVLSELYDQRLTSKGDRTAMYFKEYIKELGSFGAISDQADDNWSVTFGNEDCRIFRSSSLSDFYAKLNPWYGKTLQKTTNYAYYNIDTAKTAANEDTAGPLLVLAPSTTEATNRNVTIYVQASDKSGVAGITYLQGQYEKDNAIWSQAAAVTDHKITVSANTTLSIRAYDSYGNATVKHITISNIDPNALEKPTVSKFTNKMTIVKGDALAGLTVHVKAAGKSYTTTANAKGAYSCKIDKQKAGNTIAVYVTDGQGRTSASVYTKVLRRGPNAPTLNAVSNKTSRLKGKLNDTNTTMVIYVGKTAYVPANGGKALYKASKGYDKNKKIKNAKAYKVVNGSYTMTVPTISAKTKVVAFSIDKRGRISLKASRKASSKAPNQPKVNSICDFEKYVSGSIPSGKKGCKVTAKSGKKKYTGTSKAKGRFVIKTKGFKKGAVVTVSASDKYKGKTRTSAKTKVRVGSQTQYSNAAGSGKISVSKIRSTSRVVKGKIALKTGSAYISYGENSASLDLNKDGSFSYTLPSPKKGGSSVYITLHDNSNGTIAGVKKVTVSASKPAKPSFMKGSADKKAKKIQIRAKEKGTLVVQSSKKKIKTTKCTYQSKGSYFVYTVKVPAKAGKVRCYLKTIAGKSKTATIKRK